MQKVKKITKVASKIKKVEKIEVKKDNPDLEDIIDLDAEDDSFDLDSPAPQVNRRKAPSSALLESNEAMPAHIADFAEETRPAPQTAQTREQARERGYTTFANPDDEENPNKYLVTAERTTPTIRNADEERGLITRGRGTREAFQSEAVNRLMGRGEGSEEATNTYELKEKAKEKETKRKLPWEA